MSHNSYKLTWTFAFFAHEKTDPKEWRKFKLLYEKLYKYAQGHITKNFMAHWAFDFNRRAWIVANLPKHCSVKFLSVTDKQFELMESFYNP